jgi:hypothetical protein
VMRACEGCRRRKIKCDAATTNSWPCAACTRLKLNCVPPTVSYEKDSGQPGVHTFEIQRPNDYPTIPVGTIGDYQRQHSMLPQANYHAVQPSMHPHVPSQTYEPLSSYTTSAYMTPTTAHETAQFTAIPATTMSSHAMGNFSGYTSHPVSAVRQDSLDGAYNPSLHRANSLDSSWNRTQVDVSAMRQNSLDSAWKSEPGVSPSADALAEAMGGLKIDHLAIGKPPLDQRVL